MLMQLLYPYLRFALGTLYPSYKTWKALKRKDDTTRRRWLKYWVSYGAFQMFENVADITLAFIMPFYIELKMIALIWMVLGTKLIFDSIVNRELTRREKAIDRWLGKLNKIRDELVAIIWLETSRCSVKIITALMSGGFSMMVQSPEQSDETSPVCSDVEEVNQEHDGDGDGDDVPMKAIEQEYRDNHHLALEWSAMTLTNRDSSFNNNNISDNNYNNLDSDMDTITVREIVPPRVSVVPIRRSARQLSRADVFSK